MAISLRSPLPAFVLVRLYSFFEKKAGRGERIKRKRENLADQNHLCGEALILSTSPFDVQQWVLSLEKREREREREGGREEKTVLGADDFSSPLHLATGSVRDWFTVKENFFTHDSIWYGLGYMLPNMPVQMFSQLGVLSPVS